jgi:YD repeat-containing protein
LTPQAFDALNRRIEITDAMNGVRAFAYDARDNATTTANPRGLTTTYTYDGLDNLVHQDSPDTGTTTYTSTGDIEYQPSSIFIAKRTAKRRSEGLVGESNRSC